MLAALIRGPGYSPLLNPKQALARRNLVLQLMERDGKITAQQEREAAGAAAGTQHSVGAQRSRALFRRGNPQISREHVRHRSGARARPARLHHAQRRRMQRAADRAVRDGLHAYDRRHGWRGNLTNILRDHRGTLENYDDEDWHGPIEKGDYVNGLVLTVDAKSAADQDRALSRRSLRSPISPGPATRRRANCLQPGDVDAVPDPRHLRQHRQAGTRAVSRPAGGHDGDRQQLGRNQGHGRRLQLRGFEIQSRRRRPSARWAARSRSTFMRRLWSRASRPSTRSWTRPSRSMSGGQPTRRTTTTKNTKA